MGAGLRGGLKGEFCGLQNGGVSALGGVIDTRLGGCEGQGDIVRGVGGGCRGRSDLQGEAGGLKER